MSGHKHSRQENPVSDWVSLCLNNIAYVKDVMNRNPNKELPGFVELRRNYHYDENTGILYRRFKGTTGHTLKPVGSRLTSGYYSCSFGGVMFRLHRIIWMWMTGLDPGDDVVEHANHNRSDNRWSNLRLATNSQNASNVMKWHKGGTSKYKGVSWSTSKRRWLATIGSVKTEYQRKYFRNEIDAASWYNQKAKERWGEFAYQNNV